MSKIATQSSRRTWSFPTEMTMGLIAFTALIWLGYVIIITIATLSIDRWSSLEHSIWAQARQLAQWFLLFMGVHVGSELLPQHITHGKTRRDFFIESGIAIILLAAATSVLMLIGWVIERMVFSLLNVEQTLRSSAIFDSARDYPLIFTESFITLTLWTLGGFYIAASWYRNADTGLIAIAPALLIAALIDLGFGTRLGPIGAVLDRFFDPEHPPLLATLAIAAVGLAILGWLAWEVVREIPIRNVAA